MAIESDDWDFSKVKIEHHLGELKNVSGQIVVNYQWTKDKWQIQIELPKTISGTLIWKSKKKILQAGLNQIYE